MKKVLFFVLIGLCVFSLPAQNLNIQDLISFIELRDWSDINTVLMSKGFEYHSSGKEDIHEQTITWSYEKTWRGADDEAAAWFYLHVYDDEPELIIYEFFNDRSYKTIIQSMSKFSFVKYDQEIEDKKITISYKNANYYVKIAQKQEEKDYGETITCYQIYIIKRGGRLDGQNGNKEYVDEDGNNITYTRKDGKINGLVVVKDDEGNLIKRFSIFNDKKEGEFYEVLDDTSYVVGRYANDELEGKVKVCYLSNDKLILESTYKHGVLQGERIGYYPSGKKEAIENYKDGKLSGKVTVFNENGTLDYEHCYEGGIRNGLQKEYYYPTDSTKIIYEFNVTNNELDGKGTGYYIDNDGSHIIEMKNYKMGELDGPYFDITDDTILYCHYKDGILEGEYSCTIDIISKIIGGVPQCDTSGASMLVSHGYYCDGKRCGKWELGGFTLDIGNYQNGEKEGVWKTYIKINHDNNKQLLTAINKDDLKNLDSLQLLKETTYQHGEENGTETIYFRYDSINGSWISHKTILNYQYGKKNGIAEYYDDNGNIEVKGAYRNDEKIGDWKYYYEDGVLLEEKYTNTGVINIRSLKRIQDSLIEWDYNKWSGELLSITLFDPYIIKITDINSTSCSIMLNKNDTIVTVSKVYHDFSSFESISELFEFRNMIDNNKFSVNSGLYELKDASGRLIEKGIISGSSRTGQWEFYFYEQNVKQVVNYQVGRIQSEGYQTINSLPFSGKFEINDYKNRTKEVRNIKDGKRHGKTIFYSMETGKIIKKETYKKGVKKE